MPGQYIITEPSPSTTSYVRYGRGGAGNTFRVSSSSATTSHTVSSPVAPSSSSRRFFSGKGGAGNVHEATERPAISLDEEVQRIASQEDKAIGHCGIGGAGNVYRRKASDATSTSTISDDGRSSFSTSSSRQKLWAQVRNSLSRD